LARSVTHFLQVLDELGHLNIEFISLAVSFLSREDIYRFWDNFPPPDCMGYE